MAVADLFCTISKDDILSELDDQGKPKGYFTFMGEELKEHEIRKIAVQASNLKDSYLWKVLKAESRYQAGLKMFEHSKNDFDLIAGKQILFNLDVWATLLNKLDKVHQSLKKLDAKAKN